MIRWTKSPGPRKRPGMPRLPEPTRRWKVQRRQAWTKIALLISLTLHLIMLLVLRYVILHTHIYKGSDTLYVDLLNPLSSIVVPPQYVPRRTPIRSTRKLTAEAPAGRFSADRLPSRPIVPKITDEENIPKADIPTVDTSVRMSPSLSSPFSSVSAAGASSQGKGTGKRSGSGRGGRGAGGLVSIRPRRMPVEDSSIDEKLQIYTEADLPLIRALQEIADHVLAVRKSRKVDIVFVVDTSESMEDDIDAVRRHLNRMIERFREGGLDFTLGVVRFHHSLVHEWLGMDITLSKQTSNVHEIREILKSIKVSGGERALDAIMKAISEVKFRSGADRHFILVTDEYVKGTYPVPEVLKAAKRAKITIDVLGRDEPFQRTIAEQTGGIWTSIEKIKGNN